MDRFFRLLGAVIVLPFLVLLTVHVVVGIGFQLIVGLLVLAAFAPFAYLYFALEKGGKAGRRALKGASRRRAREALEAASTGEPYSGWAYKEGRSQCPRCGYRRYRLASLPSSRLRVVCRRCGQSTSLYCWNGGRDPAQDPHTSPDQDFGVEDRG